MTAETSAVWYVNRYDEAGDAVTVADRRFRPTAEEVAAVFQRASNDKGERFTYKVEAHKFDREKS
jgi:hypothetical protein